MNVTNKTSVSISLIRDRCVNNKIYLCLGTYPQNENIPYQISTQIFDFIVDNLNDDFLGDPQVISNLNDIYSYIRDSGFLDKYMCIYISVNDDNDYSGFVDGSRKEIIRLTFQLMVFFSNFISAIHVSQRNEYLNILEKRFERIKFLYKFVINDENKKKDTYRYGEFDQILEGFSDVIKSERNLMNNYNLHYSE